jgi:carbon monoxide dehydrogenase subunit G
MNLQTRIQINTSKEAIWKLITQIENSHTFISAIQKIEVLENPTDSFIGFKWKETRVMFGKEAVETMWVKEAEEFKFYLVEAQSHGSKYTTHIQIIEEEGQTFLQISFKAEALNFIAKVFSFLLGGLMKGSMIKAFDKDLQDIKKAAESGS